MKDILSILVCLSIAWTIQSQIYTDMAMDTTMTFEEIVKDAEAYFDIHGRGQHTGYKAFKRWEYRMKRCLDERGSLITNARSYRAHLKWKKEKAADVVRSSPQNNWVELGPVETTITHGWSSHIGRITSVAIDENNSNHILVGSPTGGIWKSEDGGASWLPIFDDQLILEIFSLAISPYNSNTYFAGTRGGGLMKSTDAGQSWYVTNGINSSTNIIDIAISPTNPNVCLAINLGGNIFHSFDAGESWIVSYLHNQTMYDIEFRPLDGNHVYASGQGIILHSSDQGWSWTELTGDWQNHTYVNPIMLAVTEDDPDYLYALEANNGGFGAVYRSVDNGGSFSVMSDDSANNNNIMGYDLNFNGGQAPRDMDIAVNPNDKNEVHVGGIMTFRSFDGAATWEQTSHWLHTNPLPFIHADVDQIIYLPGKIYFATDGGLFTSDDSATSFVDLSTGLGIRQFYRIDISEDGTLIAGGSQDNGTGRYTPTGGWLNFVGADGMEPLIDIDNKDTIYGSVQYGTLYRTSDGGQTLDGGLSQTPGFGEWVTPLVADPLDHSTIYQAKSQLYKSSNAIASWEAISNFNTNNPFDTLIQEVAISPLDNQLIFAAFEEKLYKTTDGGDSWTDISPAFPFSNINYITLHPHDTNWIAITLSGTSDRIVQSTDGGQSWTSLMSGLPDTGAEAVLYEGGPQNGIYVTMSTGVYYKSSVYPTWEAIANNLPTVLVTELAYNGCDLYAASFGRGLWQTSLLDDTQLYADLDGDGFGDESVSAPYCSAPNNYILAGGDCDDTDPQVTIEVSWYQDLDGDGFGNPAVDIIACSPPAGYVADNTDCVDSDSGVYPGAVELCDDLDNNCDGVIDEQCIECDGDILFVQSAVDDSYHAGSTLYSTAQLDNVSSRLFTAGNTIELLPGFEVSNGVEFEAIIVPCYNGVTPLNANFKDELFVMESEIYNRMKTGELVNVKVVNDFSGRVETVIYSKGKIDLAVVLKQLDLGQFVIYIESESINWNRTFSVMA